MPARTAIPSDYPAILALAAKIPASSAFNWPGAQLSAELAEAGTLVFEKDQTVRSFLCYRNLPDFFEITVLATEPGFGRLGLQTELIKSLQGLAAGQQKRILLEVHSENQAARALYQDQGFLEIHRRQKYYSDGATAMILEWRK